MLIDLLLIVVGLAALAWSADRFVFGAAAIANNYGIPPLIIGLTIVAMGSSAPEVMVSANAALSGQMNTAVGNALGSNITNIALVLGVAALMRPLAVQSGLVFRELPILLASSALVGFFMYDQRFSSVEGILILSVFFAVMLYLTLATLKQRKQQKDSIEADVDAEIPQNVSNLKAIIWLAIGLVVLAYSSELLVYAASNVARYFGMSDLLIGLTIIAIGTSLPELAACVAGVLKKEDDMVLGNIIGSNLFNILFVMAMPAMLSPGNIDPNAATRDLGVMMLLTIMLFFMAMRFRNTRVISRWEGGVLLLSFFAYQALLYITSF